MLASITFGNSIMEFVLFCFSFNVFLKLTTVKCILLIENIIVKALKQCRSSCHKTKLIDKVCVNFHVLNKGSH